MSAGEGLGSALAGLFVTFLLIYALTAGISLGRHSLAPHFVYLAESFLHGRLHLLHVPSPPYDLTSFEGRWYVSFPPLPALLMLPGVALRGLRMSDIAFSVVLGALDVSLFYAVLSRIDDRRTRPRIELCSLLGLGTPLWYCASLGSVWYTAHVVAVTCLCLYMLEVLGRNRPILAGLFLGLGSLARPPTILAFPLAMTLARHENQNRWGGIRFALLLALGMAPALLGQMSYNELRFGSPLEFGYRWMKSPDALMERQAMWGQFSLHFLPENLYTLLIRPPLISFGPLHVEPDPWGMGLLLTCPALLLTLRSGWHDPLQRGLWLSIALVLAPSLLYFNTGSFQFGYRFALDWLPLGILLIALEAGRPLRWWSRVLIVASVLLHLWGVLWMYPNFNGQPWHLQYVDLARQWLR